MVGEKRKARCRRKKLPKGEVKEGLSRWLQGKDSPCNTGATGDTSLIPGLERSSAGGNGNPLQYSCLENPMDRGALGATIHRVT